MGDHCQFIVIPADAPPYVEPRHPRDDIVSDILRAIPVPIVGTTLPVGLWVRETAAVEGQPRNVMASLLLRALSGPPIQPVVGPAVLTRIAEIPIAGNPGSLLVPEGFPPSVVTAVVRLAGDLALAMAGENSGFSVPHLDALWAASVHAGAEQARSMPLPGGWPYARTSQDRAAAGSDLVAQIMMQLGLGETFAPVPLPGQPA